MNEKKAELKRKALAVYPYIKNRMISHGRAAEMLGVKKDALIELYGNLGIAYFDMDIEEVEEEILTYKKLKNSIKRTGEMKNKKLNAADKSF